MTRKRMESMTWVLDLDAKMERRLRVLGEVPLYQTVLLSDFAHEDVQQDIARIAREESEPEGRVRDHTWLRVYLAALIGTSEKGLDAPDAVAERYQISWEDLEDYIVLRSEELLAQRPLQEMTDSELETAICAEQEAGVDS